jgi:hypothetical protein
MSAPFDTIFGAHNGNMYVMSAYEMVNAIIDTTKTNALGHYATQNDVMQKVSKTTTVNNKNLSGNITLVKGDFSASDSATNSLQGFMTAFDHMKLGLLAYINNPTFTGDVAIPSFKGSTMPTTIGIACSDETTALTASTTVAKVTFRMPYAMTVTAVRANVTTAPTGATILVDIHESGTTILSTKVMINASAYTSVGAATPYVISDNTLADDAQITIYADQIGSTIAGAGLKVWIIGTRLIP